MEPVSPVFAPPPPAANEPVTETGGPANLPVLIPAKRRGRPPNVARQPVLAMTLTPEDLAERHRQIQSTVGRPPAAAIEVEEPRAHAGTITAHIPGRAPINVAVAEGAPLATVVRDVAAAINARTRPVAAGTGVACRVCGRDDGDERVQRDLHKRCIEKAAKAARARAHPPGRRLTRATLVARLAAERAPTRSAQARATAAQIDPDEIDNQEPADLEDLREDLGPGDLSTEGLG